MSFVEIIVYVSETIVNLKPVINNCNKNSKKNAVVLRRYSGSGCDVQEEECYFRCLHRRWCSLLHHPLQSPIECLLSFSRQRQPIHKSNLNSKRSRNFVQARNRTVRCVEVRSQLCASYAIRRNLYPSIIALNNRQITSDVLVSEWTRKYNVTVVKLN